MNSWKTNMIKFKGFGYISKGDNSLKIVLFPSEKGSTLNGKNLLPVGANSLLLG